jgi:hypothetical protein
LHKFLLKTAKRRNGFDSRWQHPAPITNFEWVRSAYCSKSPLAARAIPLDYLRFYNYK